MQHYSLAHTFIAHALPSTLPEDWYADQALVPRQAANTPVVNGTTLRVLCMGASITYGWESTDGNGYRRGLRGALVNNGSTVTSKDNGLFYFMAPNRSTHCTTFVYS